MRNPCEILKYENLLRQGLQGGVTPQSSVLPPATVVKHKVKGQEAKIVKVKGQA